MSRDLPEEQYGPGFEFREYSFLEKPQAKELNASTVVLHVCKVCCDGERPPRCHPSLVWCAIASGPPFPREAAALAWTS